MQTTGSGYPRKAATALTQPHRLRGTDQGAGVNAWVLIILLAQTSYDGGMAATYVPFKTEAACLAAQATLRANYDVRQGDSYMDRRSKREIVTLCARTE